MKEETVLWRGTPSQLTHIWTYVFSGVLALVFLVGAFYFLPVGALVLLPLAYAGWTWLTVRCRVFEVTSERVRLSEGVLNRRIDEIELYRVKDTAIEKPFWLRLFRLGNLILDTSDRSHPTVTFSAIRGVTDVREEVRSNVERLREMKRVREVDFDGGAGGGEFDDGMEFGG